jgi:hypothetical protein
MIPTKTQNLKDLEAYIKLPGNYPITKLKMDYQSFSQRKIESFNMAVINRESEC